MRSTVLLLALFTSRNTTFAFETIANKFFSKILKKSFMSALISVDSPACNDGKVHEILKMGDPRLLRVTEPVLSFDNEDLHQLIRDMRATMLSVNGAGLAAPQIGVNLQLVIFGSDKKNPRYPNRPIVPPTVLINPVIEPIGEEIEEDWEGCLSVPGLRGVVPRFSKLQYSGFDEFGNSINRTVDGFHARVVQHECDHLKGILYPMRIKDFTKFGFTEVLFPEISAAEEDD